MLVMMLKTGDAVRPAIGLSGTHTQLKMSVTPESTRCASHALDPGINRRYFLLGHGYRVKCSTLTYEAEAFTPRRLDGTIP